VVSKTASREWMVFAGEEGSAFSTSSSRCWYDAEGFLARSRFAADSLAFDDISRAEGSSCLFCSDRSLAILQGWGRGGEAMDPTPGK